MSLTESEALAYIHARPKFSDRLGLDRISALLDLLGRPQERLKFVHVGGTNGKGSTVAMTANVLRQAGYRVGMFISPFVLDFRERIQVCGEMIPSEELVLLTQQVSGAVAVLERNGMTVNEFELVTAIGMLYFDKMHCDLVCLEVGLGGTYDATNVIAPPLAAVITSISLDHTQILGDSIEQIAREKAGIIKRGITVVSYPEQEIEALGVLYERCSKEQCRLVLPNIRAVQLLETGLQGSRFRYQETEYRIPLVGFHQVCNALVVIEVIELLREKGLLISDSHLKKGLETVSFPVRFETISRDPLTVIDGAHNPGGAKALSQILRENASDRKKIAVIGMLKDKSYQSLLAEIGPLCEQIIAVPVASPRALAPEELAQSARQYCKAVSVEYDYSTALRIAKEKAGREGLVLICGSLYLAADMRKILLES